jgi:hypothetical protein
MTITLTSHDLVMLAMLITIVIRHQRAKSN